MDTANRRALGLVAVASWLLIDGLRAAGPLLASLLETSTLGAAAAALAVFAAGGVLAWICALAGRHFGHGVVVLFLIVVVAVLRLGLPLLGGGWLIAGGLYLLALSITAVVLTGRVALGNGGGAPLAAGTMLGAALAVTEQTMLRTWDAVWRGDLAGWVALTVVAAAAVTAGWRCRSLEPVDSSRGWWAHGLLWAVLASAFANVGWVSAQTELRMSTATALAVVSLLTGALLAAQVDRVSPPVMIALGYAGIAAIIVLVVAPGGAAIVALPVAVAVSALAVAIMMRPAPSSVARRLGAATVFGLTMLAPLAAVAVEPLVAVPGHGVWMLIVATGALLLAAMARTMQADAPSPDAPRAPWIAPGVLTRAGAVAAVGAGAVVWTAQAYEAPTRALSADFLPAPTVMSWNINGGLQPSITGGPDLAMDEIAGTIRAGEPDVAMVQEVTRGTLLRGGIDTVEYLAGELGLPYSYAAAHDQHRGVAILTSRAHADPRTLELEAVAGPRDRTALAVDFMGATYATVRLDSMDPEAPSQADAVVAWLDLPHPVVVGGDLGAAPDSTLVSAFTRAGFVNAQASLGLDGPTYLGADPTGAEASIQDYVLGRGVDFTTFSTVGVGWSDHLPILARGATGATAPTDVDADANEPQPEAGPSPSPAPSASPSPSPSAS